jgi:chemotaxis protein MotB
MKMSKILPFFLLVALGLSSCVTKKKYIDLQSQLSNTRLELEVANKDLGKCGKSLNEYMNKLALCEQDKANAQTESRLRAEQIDFLKAQLNDCQNTRDKQLSQAEDLTKLNRTATENIRETLSQLERKDQYIHYLQNAKTRADSINLALAVNLTTMLRDGIADKDIEV